MSQGQGFPNRNLHKIKERTVNDFKAFDYVSIPVTGTVQLIPLNDERKTAKAVHLYFESSTTGRAARYNYDGTIPVSGSVGHGLSDDTDFFLYEQENIQNFRIVQEVAGTHVLHITFLK